MVNNFKFNGMKNVIVYGAAMVLFMVGAITEVHAQRGHKEDKYWERRKEADKKRAEYIRENEKKRDEYIRERRKKEDEYYRESTKRRREYHKEVRKHGRPVWASAHRYDERNHIYFPDYRTFYDPYRGGYVFLNGGRWAFSAQIPSFMINVDLGRANVRILKDIPLERHPEDFYDDYDEEYWDD